MRTFKIAVINAQSGVGSTKSYFNRFISSWKYGLPHSHKPLEIAGGMLHDEHIDIALLTEISEKSLRTGFHSQIEIVSKYSGLVEKKFFSTQKSLAFHEGNGILSRFPIISSEIFPLPSKKTKRILVKTIINIGSEKITVFVTHLGLELEERKIQLRKIEEIIRKTDGPILLGGDFNFRDGFAFEEDVVSRLVHTCTLNTFPSWEPHYTLDYLFLSKEFDVAKKYIPSGSSFSDHLPLVIETEFN